MSRYLGEWIRSTDELRGRFETAKPFPHVVIDGFFDKDVAETLIRAFPNPKDRAWFRYLNPIEIKFAMNDFTDHPEFREVFDVLQTDEFVGLVKRVTGIASLENDPHLHGAGIHYHPRGGKLDMHLDYSIHPISGKERRVNLIIYLNPEWKSEWGGSVEFWNTEFTRAEASVVPLFNRAVLFQTSDISWHGLPTPIACPESEGRKSLAIYYVSDPRPGASHRLKADFRPLPSSEISEGMRRLYEIRPHRRIAPEDLKEHVPDWKPDIPSSLFLEDPSP